MSKTKEKKTRQEPGPIMLKLFPKRLYTVIEAIGVVNSKIILGITEDKLLKMYQKISD